MTQPARHRDQGGKNLTAGGLEIGLTAPKPDKPRGRGQWRYAVQPTALQTLRIAAMPLRRPVPPTSRRFLLYVNYPPNKLNNFSLRAEFLHGSAEAMDRRRHQLR